MQNKILNFQPAVLATAALTTLGANLLNTLITTLTAGGVGFVATQPYAIIKRVRLTNLLTTTAAFATLYKGAALTSLTSQAWNFSSVSIPAQSWVEGMFQHRFDSADYLTGFSNLPNGVVISMDGEIGLS